MAQDSSNSSTVLTLYYIHLLRIFTVTGVCLVLKINERTVKLTVYK